MRTNFRLTITVLASAVALPVYAANDHGQQASVPQTHAAAPPTAHGGSHQTTHVNTTHSPQPATSHTTHQVAATSHGHAASHQTTRTTSAQHTLHVSTTSGSSHGSHTTTASTGKSSHSSHTTTVATGKSSHGSHLTTVSTGKSSHGSRTTSGTTSSGVSASTTTTSGGGTTTLSPLARKISSHPQLAAKVEAMLPMDMTLNQAARGFKNQGQLIAALHVSQNLGIPFEELKEDMTERHMSLGQSIQDLKKSASSTTEARRGEQEADEDVKSATRSHEESEREEREEFEHRLSISQRISSNTALSTKVQALLPSGMTLKQATSGFTSESQFLSALHASKDLGIPFTQIKAEMTGTDHDTLLRAIQEVKPTADAAAAVKTAQTEAAADLQTTTSTSTTSTTTTTGGGH